MSSLLELRDGLRNFYSRHEIYILPFVKFCLAFMVLFILNMNLGLSSKISNNVLVLLVQQQTQLAQLLNSENT